MSAKWDQSEFDATLKEYIKFSRRTMAEVLNNKAYYVAKASCWFTHKADGSQIRSQLGKTSLASRVKLKERKSGGTGPRPPLIAVIINSRLGKKNKPGLFGEEMETKSKAQIASRVRSTSFVKSGWIPAIRGLESLVTTKVGVSPDVPFIELIRNPEGKFRPASDSNHVAEIENNVESRTKTQKRVEQVAVDGLQRGFNNETEQMLKYIERKMAERAARDSAK